MTKEPQAARVERLLGKLDALRALDPELLQFGALDHQYRLDPVLPEAEVARFEAAHGVALPAGYRAFLTRAGNGGAGPHCGLTGLSLWRPQLRLLTRYVEFDGDRPLLQDGRPVAVDIAERPHIERAAEPWRPFVLDGPWPHRGDDGLPGDGAHPLDGCTHLAEMGDGYLCFLVITGLRAGEVWEDHTHGVAFDAIRPTGARFLDWYEGWLDSALADCRGAR